MVERGWHWCRATRSWPGLPRRCSRCSRRSPRSPRPAIVQTKIALSGEARHRAAAEAAQAKANEEAAGTSAELEMRAVVCGEHQPDATGVGHGPVESPSPPCWPKPSPIRTGVLSGTTGSASATSTEHTLIGHRAEVRPSPGRRMESCWRPGAWTEQRSSGKPPMAQNDLPSKGT